MFIRAGVFTRTAQACDANACGHAAAVAVTDTRQDANADAVSNTAVITDAARAHAWDANTSSLANSIGVAANGDEHADAISESVGESDGTNAGNGDGW